MYKVIVTALVFGALAAGPATAHHSFAMFDLMTDQKLTGTVKSYQWTNPHVFVELAVPNGAGGEDVWMLEAASPLSLRRNGWRANSFKPGDTITADIHPLKEGALGGQLVNVTLADGTFLYGERLLPRGAAPPGAPEGAGATPPAGSAAPTTR